MADLGVRLTHPSRPEDDVAIECPGPLTGKYGDGTLFCSLNVDTAVPDLRKIVSVTPGAVGTLLFTADKHDATLIRLDVDIAPESGAEGLEGEGLGPAVPDHPVAGGGIAGTHFDADVAGGASAKEVGIAARSRVGDPVAIGVVAHVVTHTDLAAGEDGDIASGGNIGPDVAHT